MHAANQTWSDKLAKSRTARIPKIRRSFAPCPEDAAVANRFSKKKAVYPVATPLAELLQGGRRVGSCPAEASPLATLCVRGKMQRCLAGNIYVFQVLWDWLHRPRCKQVYTERRFMRGEWKRGPGSTSGYCMAEAWCHRCDLVERQRIFIGCKIENWIAEPHEILSQK